MNTNKKGFGLTSLIVKIILVALSVLLLIWLFRNYSPNMKPFYNNIFRENVSYMQNGAKSYFTNDKLPTEIGKSVRLTLKQMEEMKLVIPFVDKDGKSCNKTESYAEITKEEVGYTLKVNLVCGKESDYLIEILGCHDYCSNCEVKKEETALEYEFTREVTKNIIEFSCPNGYTRNGNICSKKTGSETINATSHYTDAKTETSNVLYTSGQSQTIELSTIKTQKTETKKVYADASVKTNTTKTYTNVIKNTKTAKKYTDVIKNTNTTKKYTNVIKNTNTTKKYTDVIKNTNTTKHYTDVNRVVTQDCKDVKIKDPNCTVQCKWVTGSDGIPREVCNTCGYIIHQECTDNVAYICPNGYLSEGAGSSTKCYKNVTTTTYSCPSGYAKEGTGSNTKCYKNVTTTTYSCPSGYAKEGTGSNTKCYKNVTTTTYSCPSGYTKEGTGSSTKCYKNVTTTTYSCPSGYTKEGTGSSTKCYKNVTITNTIYSCPQDSTSNNGKTGQYLKCYKTIAGEKIAYCSNPDAKIQNNKCVLTIPSKFSYYTCPSGYTLNSKNGTCKKDIINTISATSKTTQKKETETKWSRSKTLEGWKATGKTRTVKVN